MRYELLEGTSTVSQPVWPSSDDSPSPSNYLPLRTDEMVQYTPSEDEMIMPSAAEGQLSFRASD